MTSLITLSHLPVVDLRDIGPPRPGISVNGAGVCERNFARGDSCRRHYQQLLAALPGAQDRLVQCPFGLASLPIELGQEKLAVTGFVPYPRLGGGAEKHFAKSCPELKVNAESAAAAADALRAAHKHFVALEEQTIQQHSMALHEIRKLNRTVKQTAERLCRTESPSDPDRASTEMVNIWKASELMSKQFDVIEILANESLASLPMNSVIEPYKVFDKCAHIYRQFANWKNLVLWSPYGFFPRISACDKTFPILASVLIENAIKYSVPSTEIRIEVRPLDGRQRHCIVEVSNTAETRSEVTSRILEKGVRGATDTEGSGNGLYVARLVARQHGSDLSVQAVPIAGSASRRKFTFQVVFLLAS